MKVPEIQYARSGDVSLAYVVSGEGSFDLVFVHGFVGNLETAWEQPLRQAFFERLGAFSRVIEFDRRGTGLSDRVRDVPTLESRMDDLRAVMDAAGSERAAVFATFEAGAMAALYAATYPERVAALVLYNPIAKGEWSPDYPFAPTEAEWSSELAEIRERWGQPEFFAEFTRAIAPSRADDPAYAAWTAKLLRTGASPGAALAIRRMVRDVDIRDVLPSIRVPTLVLHLAEHADESRYVAERIPGARRVEISGSDTIFFLAPGIAEELERFVKNAWVRLSPRRSFPPCSSPTSSARPNAQPSSAIGVGRSWSARITLSYDNSSTVSAAESSTRPAMVSLRALTGPPEASGARLRLSSRCERLGSRFAPASIRASVKS